MLNGSRFATNFRGLLLSRGFLDSKLLEFSLATGNGIVDSVSKKPFSTVDTGTIPGIGIGIGTGLFGIPTPVIEGVFFGTASSLALLGSAVSPIAQALSLALVNEMALAGLVSNNIPVFLGNGVIVPGSIPVFAIEVAAKVRARGNNLKLRGIKWPDMCQAIGRSVEVGLKFATGKVTITGVPTGPTSGGVGAGSGTIK